MRRWSMSLILVALSAIAAPARAEAPKIAVSADSIRMENVPAGETARAIGHVKILIPGQVRIYAPEVRLFKGPDGKLSKAVFPTSVRIVQLQAGGGQWQTEDNRGGSYDFRTHQYTEWHPRGDYVFTPHSNEKTPAVSQGAEASF
ncbi:MAG TPA: hypothetical protein V6D47_02400 [Oscillatoriaceae cyanobacterium]